MEEKESKISHEVGYEKEEQHEKKSHHEEHHEKEEQHEKKSHHEEHHEKKEQHKKREHHENKNDHGHKKVEEFSVSKLNSWQIASGLLTLLLIASIFTQGFSFSNDLSGEAAADKALVFINDNLLQGQVEAELKEISEKAGLYSLSLNIQGQEMESYVTKDGALLFPQAISLEEIAGTATVPAAQQAAVPEVVKSDKPIVELFVMSHCPYGTQAVKGILPVAEKLGDKIDFEIKFVYYAMHGKKELDEQLNQECIKREQNDKFNAYLTCFLGSNSGSVAEGQACLTEVGVDESKLSTCVTKLDTEYKITEQFEDQSTWLNGRFPLFDVDAELNTKYKIKGSPGLIINGESVNSERSPAAYLASICAAFNEAPEECETEMSTTAYSPGFGYQGTGNSAGGCIV